MNAKRGWSWLLAVVVVTAGACASDPQVIESTGASTVAPSTETSSSTTEADPTTTAPAPSSTTASAAPTTTATATSSTTTTSGPPTSTTIAGSIVPLGDFLLVDGEFVKISEVEDPDAECTSGSLAVRSEGEISHVYEELGPVLALQLIEGLYAQTVLVETCEESLIRLIFTSTARVPEDGIPDLTVARIPENVFHLSDYWWGRDGWFHADAVFYDGEVGWNDHVVFDTFDGSMRLLADVFGERLTFDNGIDLVRPYYWEFADGDPALDTVELVDTETSAAVTITTYPSSVPAPEPRTGEELYNSSEVYVDFWEEIGDGRSRTIGEGAMARDHWFSGPEGVRQVRTVDLDDRSVRIVAFTPAGAGAINEYVPTLTLDQVRIYTAVG